MKDAFLSYENKKVLVTGHTGFKGGWLATWLKALGANVIGLALPPEDPDNCLFNAAQVANGMTSILGDIRNLDAVEDVFVEHRPEIVFHLAAQALVRRSYNDPVGTYATNVMGTVHVLEMARRSESVRAVVNVTSDKCYENKESEKGYREADPLGGRDPYSSSKACSELVTAAFRASFFEGDRRLSLASVRAGNVIGGGDWAQDRLVPDTVRALLQGKPVVLRNPKSVRPWQHVLDPLSGYLLLGSLLIREAGSETSGETGLAEAWNFGPSTMDTLTVEEVVQRMIELWGEGSMTVASNGNEPHETGQLKLDCSKSRARLGWQPMTDLTQALALTVDWYRKHSNDGASARLLTEQQIEEYMAGSPA